MTTEARRNPGQDEERPVGVNSRQVFLAVFIMMVASILLLLAIRYAFL